MLGRPAVSARSTALVATLVVLAGATAHEAETADARAAGGRRDLGTLGGASSTAVAVSARGVVVGTAETATGADHAVAWTPRGGMRDLGTLGGRQSRAVAVNERGAVAGTAQTAGGSEHAFVWTPNAGMRDLGTLGGRASTAVAINDRGQVVGDADTATRGRRAFHWRAGSGMRELVRQSWLDPAAVDVNNRGEALGRYRTTSSPLRAFVWSPGLGARDIGDLGARYITEPADLNDRSQVVGLSWVTGGGSHHAFVWDRRTGMRDLGTGQRSSVPCVFSQAVAINNRGQVAGARVDNDGQNFCRGVFWSRSARSTDLRFDPTAVNDRGLVVGSSAASIGDPSDDPGLPSGHAFCWSRHRSRMTDLGPGTAVAVNRRGTVAGSAPVAGGSRHAAVWSCRGRG
jgi:probable HAF family extracellular repeat protein